MGDRYELMLTKPREYHEDSSVVFWLKETPNFPLVDAILYRSEGGMPKDVVFLQCSVLSPVQHAGPKTMPKPSRAVLCGKCEGRMPASCDLCGTDQLAYSTFDPLYSE